MTDWKADLDEFFSRQEQLERSEAERLARYKEVVDTFVTEIVVPAFEQLKTHFEKHGREVTIVSDLGQATITVIYDERPEILYRLYAVTPEPSVEYAYISQETGKAVKATDVLTLPTGVVPLEEISQEIVIEHFIRKYKSVVA